MQHFSRPLALGLLLAASACSKTTPKADTPATPPPTVQALTSAAVKVPAAPVPTPTTAAETPTIQDQAAAVPETAPPKSTETPAPFAPQEVRDFCALTAKNAEYFAFISNSGENVPSAKVLVKIDNNYQYNTGPDIFTGQPFTDDQRQALSRTLWVLRAFTERVDTIRRHDQTGDRMQLSPDFPSAAEQWCQNSMRGDQPPFTYGGKVVPYIEIHRK